MNTQMYDPFIKLEEQSNLFDILSICIYKIRHNDLRLFITGEIKSGKTAYLTAVQEQVISDTLLGRREPIQIVHLSAEELVEALEWRKRVESCYGSLQRRQLGSPYIILVDDFHLIEMNNRSTENLLKPFLKRTRNVIVTSRDEPSKDDIFDDFQQIKIEAIKTEESIEKILHAYIAKFNVTRVTDVMIEVIVKLVCDDKICIDEAKAILRRVKNVNSNLTRAIHNESFHHLFCDFDLDKEVRRLVWAKMGEKGGK